MNNHSIFHSETSPLFANERRSSVFLVLSIKLKSELTRTQNTTLTEVNPSREEQVFLPVPCVSACILANSIVNTPLHLSSCTKNEQVYITFSSRQSETASEIINH